MSFIDESDIVKHLSDKTILISHGGVGSEYLTKLLQIKYPDVQIKGRPLVGTIVHFPYPPPKLNKVIYLYGDILNSIISQIPRHYDNAAKLCNNTGYKHFHSLEELVNFPKQDPFNIANQILRFMNDKCDYPIIILKYGFNKSLIPVLIEVTDNNNFEKYEFKQRNSKFEKLNNNLKTKLFNIYGKINYFVNESPQLIIRYPSSDYKLSQKDVIKYVVNNKYPGIRIKHYIKINGFEMYNETDYENKSRFLRLKKPNDKEYKRLIFPGVDYKRNYGGIEDPRYFTFRGDTYSLMNGMSFRGKRNMYLYNVNKNIFSKLFVINFDISKIQAQKNWIPFIHMNELYFIYSLDQLCILKVIDTNKGACYCIKGNPFKFNNDYKYFGSSPLIMWNYPNYIGFVHTRSPYYSCPIIFNVEKMEVMRIGEEIIFENPEGIESWRGRIVQFPFHLRIDNENIILSIDFEDRCPTDIYLNYNSFCKAFS